MLHNSRDVLLAYEWKLRPIPLFLSFVIYGVALALTVVAWASLMRHLGVAWAWRKHLQIYSVTNVAQRLPGVFWHVAGRMALYQKYGVTKTTVGVVSGLELVLMLIAGFLVALVSWPISSTRHFNRPELLIGGLLAGLLFLHPRILQCLLGKLKLDITVARGVHYRDIAFLVSLYVIVWVLGGMILFGTTMAIYPVPITAFAGILGAWALSGVIASAATFTPSGFGVREISLGLLLTPFMPAGMGAVIAIVTRIFLTLCELFWAFAAGRLSQEPKVPSHGN